MKSDSMKFQQILAFPYMLRTASDWQLALLPARISETKSINIYSIEKCYERKNNYKKFVAKYDKNFSQIP
jgi:hypothetical protein